MRDRDLTILAGFGLLSLGVWLYMKRQTLTALGKAAIDSVNASLFEMVIPGNAVPYADVIRRVASETGVDPFLVTAVGQRESAWGATLDANGLGDNGHGHGIMQIDDGTWGPWLDSNDWKDPYTNVKKGAQILASNLSYFQGKGLAGDALAAAALAAYNHGPGNVWSNLQHGLGVDEGTTGGNYGTAVASAAGGMAGAFMSASGLGVA